MPETPHSSPRHNLLVMTATLGMMRIEVAVAQQRAVFPMSIERTIGTVVGRTTSEARNLAMKSAYADHFEFLLFWDDDIVPRDYAASAKLMNVLLHNPQVAVVGAVYPRKISSTCEPIVFKERGETPWWGWQDGRVHEVYMTGTGFMMLRVEDIAQIPVEATKIGNEDVPDLFRATEEEDLRQTDDFYFAELCHRAKKRMFVHGGVVCDQLGTNGHAYQVGPPPDTLVENEIEQPIELLQPKEEQHG